MSNRYNYRTENSNTISIAVYYCIKDFSPIYASLKDVYEKQYKLFCYHNSVEHSTLYLADDPNTLTQFYHKVKVISYDFKIVKLPNDIYIPVANLPYIKSYIEMSKTEEHEYYSQANNAAIYNFIKPYLQAPDTSDVIKILQKMLI